MEVLIVRDGGANKFRKTVGGIDDVAALRNAGHVVEVIDEAPAEEAPEAESTAAPKAAKKKAKA